MCDLSYSYHNYVLTLSYNNPKISLIVTCKSDTSSGIVSTYKYVTKQSLRVVQENSATQ